MDFLLFPGGILGMVVVLFLYLRKQKTGQRALRIAKATLTPQQEIESGYAAVATSMRALRKAKQDEHQLLLRNWQNSYMALLPDTDPEKSTYQAQLQGVKIETAGFILDKNGMRAKDDIPLVEDGPEWKPLNYGKHNPDEEFTYMQRRIQPAGAFIRSEPHTDAKVYGVAEGNSIGRFDGYVHGEPVNGNTVWFVFTDKKTGLRKHIHSVATTDRSTSGMPNLTPQRNMEQGRVKVKYNPEPKTSIPSTIRKSWY